MVRPCRHRRPPAGFGAGKVACAGIIYLPPATSSACSRHAGETLWAEKASVECSGRLDVWLRGPRSCPTGNRQDRGLGWSCGAGWRMPGRRKLPAAAIGPYAFGRAFGRAFGCACEARRHRRFPPPADSRNGLAERLRPQGLHALPWCISCRERHR